MRKIPAVVAVLGLSALTLVGCSSQGAAASCERIVSDAAVLDLVEVTGETGTPEATTSAPVYSDETVFTDLEIGDGPAVTSDAQEVQFTATILNGATGQTLLTSGTQVTPVAEWAEFYGGIAKALDCATEGSRILAVMSPDDLSTEAATNLGIGDGESAIFVIDLEKVFRAAADGEAQYNDASGMPSVVLAPDGRPGITVPDAPAPEELVVETLKKGDGPVVTASDTPRVHYTGVLWEDGEVFDSSWEKGASAAFSLDAVVPGFAQAIEGQTVGSQVLAVIPPEHGYGDAGSGTIPGGATLVFVIDILGIEDDATQ